MSTQYHRVSHDPLSRGYTRQHVISTLSSMVSPTDDPDEFASEVEIEETPTEDGNVRIFGSIDRDVPEYELPKDYVEPEGNHYQRGFGERLMTPEELEVHLQTKEMYL